MIKLSVILLTFNEERNIKRCIESVLPVADEIIVVDSFSTDNTAAICSKYAVRFIENPFAGYIEQKNFALSLTSYNYVLSLDADEALSEELINSILEAKQNWDQDGYLMNRLSNYCGKWIHHSGWYPDRKLRLFDSRKGRWGGINPHDKFMLDKNSKTGFLKGDLFHFSYYSFEEHEAQVEKFAEIASRSLLVKGVKSNPFKLVYKPVARFLKTYIINRGFLDGRAGFVIAKMTAKASYLRYLKLYKLQSKNESI
ncbi:MAG: glycosyltransferase family 2 protein [Bacteroidetes bacterium]|nr:glycosyltransferase family 2 protein [Bacteroidota bacterium]